MTSRLPGLARFSLQLIAAGCVLAGWPRCQAENPPAPAPTTTVDPAAAALAGFDETTGLWFPPDAPRDVYLENSDPNHNLTRDIQKAFAANPALRKAACALATDPKREVRTSVLDMSMKQMRTRFHMLCAGAEGAEKDKKRNEEVWQENEARFERTRNAASARALSDEERQARFLEMNAGFTQPADVFERLDRAFEMLGLEPQAETALYRVLATSPFKGTQNEARFHDYLRHLFSRESAAGMPEAGRYRMAIRNHLFLHQSVVRGPGGHARPPRGGITCAMEDEQPRRPRPPGSAWRRRFGAQASRVPMQAARRGRGELRRQARGGVLLRSVL